MEASGKYQEHNGGTQSIKEASRKYQEHNGGTQSIKEATIRNGGVLYLGRREVLDLGERDIVT